MQPQEFAEKWRRTSPNLSERAAYQEHWRDLCALLGEPTPSTDATGEHYAFEKHVKKAGTGETGYADVFYRDHFIVEYKGHGKSLGRALQQALLYARELDNPPLLVVSDLATIEIHTNFTGSPRTVRLTLDDIAEDAPVGGDFTALTALRALFHDPERFNPRHLRERVTEAATAQMGRVARALTARGAEPGQAEHFLMRLVFAMFAEDVGLLPRGLLTRILTRSREHPERSRGYFQDLFAAMQEGGEFWGEDIRYFNGGLFDDQTALALSREDAEALLQAAQLDWSAVEPAIFGTLFEHSLHPDVRAMRGAHYTAVPDIVRLTEPVIMQPLRREWLQVKQATDQAVSRRGGQAEALALVSTFHNRLAQVRVLDPACGSGNFLVVALGQLLDLEHEVRTFAFELGAGPFAVPPRIHPQQFLGIEIEEIAHELASVTVWIAFFQWKAAHGGEWGNPVLQQLDSIQHRDAVLTPELTEAEWPEADFIVGNPPFMGDKAMRTRLRPEYTAALRRVYGDRLPGQSDLVCYWVEKAREAIAQRRSSRAGFVTTNSIRTGKNRVVLEKIKETGDLFMAWPDEPWLQVDAAVRVSIFAFDDGREQDRRLNGEPVSTITPSLTTGVDVSQARRLLGNAGRAFIGGMKKGRFEIPGEVAQAWLDLPNNGGVSNREVLFPWINGMDIARRPSNRWIIDFGTRTEAEARQYLMPFEHVLQQVKPEREQVLSTQEREQWWRHGRTAPDLRRAIADLPRFIGIPRVARHLLPVWLQGPLVVDGQVVVVACDDDFTFGVLASRIHQIWAHALGSFMGVGNDLRYTPSTCFETFPFPTPDPAQQSDVEQAAREVVAARDYLLAQGEKETLTGLYNAVEQWQLETDTLHPVAPLALAHRRLDQTVAAAYGWPWPLGTEDVLARLLTLNLARAASEGTDRDVEQAP